MIEIPQYILDEMIKQAYDELPNEACGLLVGKEGRIEKRFPMTNIDHSPEHFSFDPAEQFRVLKETRKDGLKILANYHSHPATPARPSEEDIRLAHDPDIIYIIVSLAGDMPDVKAFSIRQGMCENMQIKIT